MKPCVVSYSLLLRVRIKLFVVKPLSGGLRLDNYGRTAFSNLAQQFSRLDAFASISPNGVQCPQALQPSMITAAFAFRQVLNDMTVEYATLRIPEVVQSSPVPKVGV